MSNTITVRSCECEHEAHFECQMRTPNGNPGHKYGQKFNVEVIQSVPTPYGFFNVCPDCAKDCYHHSQFHG